MGDWTSNLLAPLPVICTMSKESLSDLTLVSAGSFASGTLVANQAHFQPFRLDIGGTVVKMAYLMGATATGNVDLGIYDGEFNLLVSSGATAQGTINVLQELDITDTELHPGNYWMAFSASSASGTAFQTAVADETFVPALPLYIQASAHPLPSTATPVKDTNTTPKLIPLMLSFDTLI